MKLKNKLLPLLTISGAACIITPLVTSCNDNAKVAEVSWDYTQGVFEYTTEKHSAQAMDPATALKTYFQAAESNKLLLAEDLVQKMSYYETVPIYWFDYNIVPLKAYAKVTDVHYANGAGYATMNVKFEGLTSTTILGETILDTYAAGELQLNNIEFNTITHVSTSVSYENLWDIKPSINISGTQSEDWSATLNFSVPADGYTYYEEFNQDDEDNDVAMTIIAGLANSVSPDYCHYLNNVTLSH